MAPRGYSRVVMEQFQESVAGRCNVVGRQLVVVFLGPGESPGNEIPLTRVVVQSGGPVVLPARSGESPFALLQQLHRHRIAGRGQSSLQLRGYATRGVGRVWSGQKSLQIRCLRGRRRQQRSVAGIRTKPGNAILEGLK